MKRHFPLFAPLALVLIVGCGGSTTSTPAPSPATSLAYTDPKAAAGDWKLVLDAASTSTHLVLNLMGPTDGTKYRGVGFTLQSNPTLAKFARFKDANGNPLDYHKDGGVFMDAFRNLYNTDPVNIAPTLQASGVSNGQLMVGIFQKSDDETWTLASSGVNGATAKDCSGSVLQVAIDFDPSLKAMPGGVPLNVLKARVIPEHVATYATRKPVDVSLEVGTLTLK